MDTISQGRDLAALAGLLADDSRATFCMALLDGRAWTAGELARHTGIAASTASDHLTRLVAGGILVERRQGRHRYVALADARVAQMLEDLTAHLEPAPEHPRTLRAISVEAALAGARTCYDHLAGRLGVAIADAMTRKGLIDQTDGIALTEAGGAWLASELAIDVEALRAGPPPARARVRRLDGAPPAPGGLRGRPDLPAVPGARLDSPHRIGPRAARDARRAARRCAICSRSTPPRSPEASQLCR